MENKINIAQLLKDCPQGMELDCVLYDDVTLECVSNDNCYPIKIHTPEYNILLNKYGGLSPSRHAKCVIFPKGKTSWEGFVSPREFKDGDVIFTHANCLKVGLGNTWISIYQENRNGGVATYVDYAEDGSDYYSDIDGDKTLLCMEKDILRQRLATEEEKQKLFQAIKEHGYKWNEETKTLEKLIEPKFKVGDKVKRKDVNYTYIITIAKLGGDYYDYVNEDGQCGVIHISKQDDWELVPNKFDISTLKPFDKVLARDNDSQKWDAELFSFYNNESEDYHFQLVGVCSARYCIPYEENKHLLGTSNDCDEYFKTWE